MHYADLETKVNEVAIAFEDSTNALKAAERKLSDMAVLMKHIQTYQQTKPACDGLRTAQNRDAYRREHESDIILHEAAARALRAARPDGGRLPNLTTLEAEHARLTERKDAFNGEHAKLKRQAREYGIIKRNVDLILNPGVAPGVAQAKRKRGVEL